MCVRNNGKIQNLPLQNHSPCIRGAGGPEMRKRMENTELSYSHLDQNVKDFFPCLWGQVVEIGKDSTHVLFCNSISYPH